jgi:hypothetical protein
MYWFLDETKGKKQQSVAGYLKVRIWYYSLLFNQEVNFNDKITFELLRKQLLNPQIVKRLHETRTSHPITGRILQIF